MPWADSVRVAVTVALWGMAPVRWLGPRGPVAFACALVVLLAHNCWNTAATTGDEDDDAPLPCGELGRVAAGYAVGTLLIMLMFPGGDDPTYLRAAEGALAFSELVLAAQLCDHCVAAWHARTAHRTDA